MDDVQLANWYAGDTHNLVEVYRVFEPVLIRALGVESGAIVWLSDYTLTKTGLMHPEIDFRDYQRLPEIISTGFVSPGNKKRSVEIIHADLSGERFKFWHVSLKEKARDTVFVNMFHRGRLKNVRRLYRRAHKKGTLLRDHNKAPVRHLFGRTSADA